MWSIFRTVLTVEDLLEEFWHNPNVFFGLAFTLVTAITLPFIVALVFRAWWYFRRNIELEQLKAKDQKIINKQKKESSKVSGYFNSSMIETLYQIPLDENNEGEKVELLRNYDNMEDCIQLEDDRSNEKDPLPQEENERSVSKKKVKSSITEPDEATSRVLKDLTESGLHGKLATAQLRAKTTKIEQNMSDEEREKESEIRRAQLEAIFQMMKNQGDKFGLENQSDLVEQLKLYSV